MKIVVITGVTSGFGMQWLYDLDKQGSIRFLVVARNRSKFEEMLKIKPLRNSAKFIECDLLSLDSVDKAVRNIQLITESVDVLINNAGLWSGEKFKKSRDGIESTLAVNHIAPFLLTGKLWPLLQRSDNARVVNTASFRHKDAQIDKSDIQLIKNFNAEKAYCNSKLYSILFTKALARKCAGSGVTVNCFDPGIVDTPMLRQALPAILSPA